MAQEKRPTHIDPYDTKRGTVVSGHTRRVTVGSNKQEDEGQRKEKAEGVRDAISQYVSPTNQGAVYMKLDDDTSSSVRHFRLVDGGGYVGLTEEAAKAEDEYETARIEAKRDRTPENLEKLDETRRQYRKALAGDEYSYIYAKVHIRDEAVHYIRPRTKIEQENHSIREAIFATQRAKGVVLLPEPEPFETYMRLKLREEMKTPADAVRFLLPSADDKEVTEALEKMKKPSLLQRTVSRSENRKLKKILKKLNRL